MFIGIDPHKLSDTATAVEPLTNVAVASLRIDASLAGYRQLMRWAQPFPERRWAVENAKGLGCHLAQWLVPATRPCSTWPPRRHRGCVNSPVEADGRTTSSTHRPLRVSPRSTVMPRR